jgi:hypothetical protein
MRLVIILVLALSLVLVVGSGGLAGDTHNGSGLKCYQCHVMHQTKSHGYADDTGSSGSWLPAAGQAYGGNLLKFADTNTLCLSCHNNGDGKDVYKGFNPDPGKTASTINRIGGWFGLSTDTAAPGFTGTLANSYGHDLNNGAQVPPGGSTAVNLDCASCHEPHGNAYYRNLKDLKGGGASGITYSKVTNDPATDVFQAGQANLKFDVSDISYNAVAGDSHYEQFCVSCHTGIHGDSSAGGFLKHPTIGFSRSYTDGTVSPLKTLGGTPIAGQTGALIAGQVSCVTCHKAHGSDHPFGLIYDNRTTVALEDSAPVPDPNDPTKVIQPSIRMTCKHCHDKGLVPGVE